MQLIKHFKQWAFVVLIVFGQGSPSLFAQDSASIDTSKIKLDDIEAQFFLSYYEQDGNHSPVTGGQGTERLTNVAPSVSIKWPTDTNKTLYIDAGVDFYSSASTDNIDNPYLVPDHVSGPSAQDERTYGTVQMKYEKSETTTWGWMGGMSFEWDVFSYYGGLSLGLESKDGNRGLDLKSSFYFDDWKLIYPIEFRNGRVSYLDTDKRLSFNTTALYSANLTRRMAIAIGGDVIVQQGLLSTPFHRVYFSDSPSSGIEMLPSSRIKTPVSLRVNVHATSFLIVKSFYRYYSDSWDLTAHTFELTTPIKASQAWRFYPFARYSSQSGAQYFAEYGMHQTTDEFYTSDFDLSTFDSFKYGLGVAFTPLFGVAKLGSDQQATIKTLEARYARYNRSDGLQAGVITLSFTMKIKQ